MRGQNMNLSHRENNLVGSSSWWNSYRNSTKVFLFIIFWALFLFSVRATNSNSRDLEEIHQRKLFYEKYPRDGDISSSVKASPVASSTKSTTSTPTSETRSNEATSVSEIVSDSKFLEEENQEDSKENNDFDLPPLEEIPKLPERLNQLMDDR